MGDRTRLEVMGGIEGYSDVCDADWAGGLDWSVTLGVVADLVNAYVEWVNRNSTYRSTGNADTKSMRSKMTHAQPRQSHSQLSRNDTCKWCFVDLTRKSRFRVLTVSIFLIAYKECIGCDHVSAILALYISHMFIDHCQGRSQGGGHLPPPLFSRIYHRFTTSYHRTLMQ